MDKKIKELLELQSEYSKVVKKHKKALKELEYIRGHFIYLRNLCDKKFPGYTLIYKE